MSSSARRPAGRRPFEPVPFDPTGGRRALGFAGRLDRVAVGYGEVQLLVLAAAATLLPSYVVGRVAVAFVARGSSIFVPSLACVVTGFSLERWLP